MLRSLKELERYAVSATDGDLGTVVNFLFDDERWAVRHLVVDVGNRLDGRRPVLISPISFRSADWSTRQFQVGLTMDAIRHSPSIDLDRPVSRQHEADYYRYYGYPYYWGLAGAWGLGAYPGSLLGGSRPAAAPATGRASDDVHLRSVNEVRGYHVKGSDEEIGHIHDFIVDDETWEIRYLVIDTRNWWFGKKVLVSPHWATQISWAKNLVYVDMTRQAIKDSPEWSPETGVNRAYEARLYDYYGRPVYWDATTPPAAPPPQRRSGAHP
jgi:hypothetical protein